MISRALNGALLVAPGFLLALVSLFAVAGNNHAHLDFAELRLLAICLLAGFALFFLLAWWLSGNFAGGAKGLTYFALLWLFFIFFDLLGKAYLQERYSVWFVIGLLVVLAGLMLLKRRSLPFSRETQFIFLIFFLIMLAIQLPSVWKILGSSRQATPFDDVEKTLAAKSAATLPHVVYIVPDRYASDKVLRDLYGYDNSPFTTALKERGFYVWDRQFANYPKTFQSLAATMNMNYLDELAARLGPEETSYVPVYRLLEDNQALRILRRSGYRYIHMGNWWEPTRTSRQADYLLTYDSAFREFTRAYLSVTPAAFLNELLGGTTSVGDMCALIERQADRLVALAGQSNQPGFFFWHLYSVHDPYLYDEEGNCRDYREYGLKGSEDRAGHYLNQISHTNTMLLNIIDRLREQSDREFVFIILSDEGPFPWDYFTNLDGYEFHQAPDDELRRKLGVYSAIYLPSGNYPNFDKESTSINVFRLVFNEIYAANLPMLDHRVYSFNRQTHPYELADITARIKN